MFKNKCMTSTYSYHQDRRQLDTLPSHYINNLRAAVTKLKEINWLYKSVNDSSLDNAARQVIEVWNNTTNTLIKEAMPEDIASFQLYTVRGLDDKLNTDSAVSQYKINHIPIDSCQSHLEAICFPTLSNRTIWGNYFHLVKPSHFKYVKSCLLRKDSLYRECAQYV